MALVTSQTARPPPLLLMIYGSDREGYRDYLTASGFRVAEAMSAHAGFAQALTLLPALIVLDFGLNSDLVKRLREEPATSAIPIIALADITLLQERAMRRASSSGEGVE
jgi:DNA-binding response OmpR family regulator